jgi:hypothetical protein
MAEFVQTNNLGHLSKIHHNAIHKRFGQLGLTQVRRRRAKQYAELVWVRADEIQEINEFTEKLKELTL